MKYDNMMDKECIILCDAINSLPGLRTYESCCGHGGTPLRIWFEAESSNCLVVLTRVIDRRYGGPQSKDYKMWTCEAVCTDTYPGVVFYLSSSTKGEEAYKQANIIAENIYTSRNICYVQWLYSDVLEKLWKSGKNEPLVRDMLNRELERTYITNIPVLPYGKEWDKDKEIMWENYTKQLTIEKNRTRKLKGVPDDNYLALYEKYSEGWTELRLANEEIEFKWTRRSGVYVYPRQKLLALKRKHFPDLKIEYAIRKEWENW